MDIPSFSVKVAKLAVGRFDLFGIDLGMVSEHVLPPLLFV